MSILDEITADSTHRSGPGCRFGYLLEQMDAADAADVRRALPMDGVTSAAISRVLAKRGIEVPEGTVSRHRKGKCRCTP